MFFLQKYSLAPVGVMLPLAFHSSSMFLVTGCVKEMERGNSVVFFFFFPFFHASPLTVLPPFPRDNTLYYK